jgi:hypothetical protein
MENNRQTANACTVSGIFDKARYQHEQLARHSKHNSRTT